MPGVAGDTPTVRRHQGGYEPGGVVHSGDTRIGYRPDGEVPASKAQKEISTRRPSRMIGSEPVRLSDMARAA